MIAPLPHNVHCVIDITHELSVFSSEHGAATGQIASIAGCSPRTFEAIIFRERR